jgi:dipeptidyl aminopeptidase/acylaminoacyl peptidase
VKKKVLYFFVVFLAFSLAFSAEKRKFTVDDYSKIKRISDIQISPDCKKVAFVKREIIPDKSKKGELKRTRDIYMVSLADNNVHRLTTHQKGSSYPRWSPDGKYLAILSSRSNKSQIWLLDMESGGEAQQLTDWKSSIEEFAWSPDSKQIAFVSTDPKDEEKDKEKKKKNDPYVITRTKFLYDGLGYFGDPREWKHIWIFSIADPQNPRKITDGNFDDGSIQWSSDGSQIAFVSNRTGDDDNNDNDDIWVVPSKGGKVRQITTNIGSNGSPRWSPDGKSIAYVANNDPNNLYKLNRLWVIPAEGGNPRCLSKELDRGVRNIYWSKNSQFIYALIPDRARVHVYRFSLKDRKISKIIGGEKRLSRLTLSKDGSLFAFTLEDNDHIAELYSASSEGKNLVQRTQLNKELLDQLQLGKTEKIRFKNPDRQMVEGFVLKPPDFDPETKYPLILKIHGGPQGTDGNYFSAEGQWYAANGYIVLWVNYRGSSDYGEAWQEAIAVDWYFKEYDDLMAAVDFMCEKDFVDSQRLGVTGVSYGGCMTSWIVGHTDRFAAAVAERFVADNFSSFGVDDTAYWYEKDFGLPYDEKNFTQYRKTSPILYIKNCTTPILIIQCMEDHRCPLPQALQFYMGLKKLKKAETKLVLYPRESHGIKEIPHLADRLKRIVSWFDKYLKK